MLRVRVSKLNHLMSFGGCRVLELGLLRCGVWGLQRESGRC